MPARQQSRTRPSHQCTCVHPCAACRLAFLPHRCWCSARGADGDGEGPAAAPAGGRRDAWCVCAPQELPIALPCPANCTDLRPACLCAAGRHAPSCVRARLVARARVSCVHNKGFCAHACGARMHASHNGCDPLLLWPVRPPDRRHTHAAPPTHHAARICKGRVHHVRVPAPARGCMYAPIKNTVTGSAQCRHRTGERVRCGASRQCNPLPLALRALCAFFLWQRR